MALIAQPEPNSEAVLDALMRCMPVAAARGRLGQSRALLTPEQIVQRMREGGHPDTPLPRPGHSAIR